ncbi:MAG: hypothetical protein QXY54_01140 [Nitrososphaerota archaeon]
MTRYLLGLAALLMLLSLAQSASAETEAMVWNRYGLPMGINGELVEKVPAPASLGSTVCVGEQVHYLTPERRLVFNGWSGDGVEPCILVSAAGNYEASYVEELLVVVDSSYQPLRRSFWARKGESILLEVQKEYVEEGYRYVFERWSKGENPFDTVNNIVVLEPLYIEAKFRKEVRLQVVSLPGILVNGTGWYSEGEVTVISAPREIRVSESERLLFREWVSIGRHPAVIYNTPSSVTTIEVRGPHIIKAEYDRYFLVNAMGPQGVILSGWFREGEVLQISAPILIEIIPDSVRLAFKGWSGDLSHRTNTLSIVLERPLNINAAYVTEYRVEVRSPVGGSGAGWYEENATAIIRVPAEVQALLFTKRALQRFSGDCGDFCLSRGPLILKVDSPKTVEAVYALEPDLPSIGAAGSTAAALSAVYFFSSRRTRIKAKDYQKSPPVQHAA